MSADLATRIQLGLHELVVIRNQMSPLIARTGERELPVMETTACAMLHSFYTEIEKILKIIAIDHDRKIPSFESWHRDLLTQMAAATETRPPVITSDLVTRLAELLAFRHLFRGASIALMRWNKLSPLVARVDEVHQRNRSRVHKFSALSSDGFGRSQQIDWQKWNDINPGRGRPKVGKRILLPVSASSHKRQLSGAMNMEMVKIVQHERRRAGCSGSRRG